MTTIRVNRKMWKRGRGTEGTYLYNSYVPTHNMCCLGFACEQGGISKDMLDRKISPCTVPIIFDISNLAYLVEAGSKYNSEFASHAMIINDNISISDEERESKLIELGKQFDVEFIFEGEG